MCAIVGYVGGRNALDVVIAGLRRLEYRDYDSAGVAVPADGGLAVAKKAGRLADLEKALAERPLPVGAACIGHTRRATYGGPADADAHPHLDGAGRIALVHNGAIGNCAALRAELLGRGHELTSQTDTEVVAHLLAESYSACADLAEAMRQVCRLLEGAFTLAAVCADDPEAIVGACRDAPLVVGAGDGENFLASEAAALRDPGSARAARTGETLELGRDQVVELRRDGVTVTGFDGTPVEARAYRDGGEDGGAGRAER